MSIIRLLTGAGDAVGRHARDRRAHKRPPPKPVTTSSGVYTAAQATRGEQTYMSICVPVIPTAPTRPPAFRAKWNGHLLSELFSFVSTHDAEGAAGRRSSRRNTRRRLAYILRDNGAPAGKEPTAGRRQGVEADPHRHAGQNAGAVTVKQKEKRHVASPDDQPHRSRAGYCLALVAFGVLTVYGDQQRRGDRAAISCAATSPASGVTGAGTRGARATLHSTRSTPSNFGSLKMAWQWNAGAFGSDEYLPDDAALRERTALHGRDHAPDRRRDRSGKGRDALDVADGRRHPLAEGAQAVRRPRPRLLDRRQDRTRHRRHAGLPHGVARREDRSARSGVRQGRHRRPDGRSRIPARAARGRRSGSAGDQRCRAGAARAAG